MVEVSAARTWWRSAAGLRQQRNWRSRGGRFVGSNRVQRLLVSTARSAWRIVRADRAKHAFTGDGSRLLGGRWNSRGVAVIYASEHESLAALELLVHTMPLSPLDRFLSFRIEWNGRLTEYFPVAQLPTDWNSEVPTTATQRIGDDWVHERRTAVLAVPAVLSTSELNFLLNPTHPDFKRIKIGKPIEYRFEPRLLRR